MLEDLKNFYANTFNYKGEATAHEVYNPLIASAALGILFAIANSFVQGYVAKWVVGFITAVWGIATVLAFTSIGVRRVGWLRRSVAGLVFAALCAVLGVSLLVYGFGVSWLLGGVIRRFWGYCGVGLLALGAVVWCVTVLPSKGMTSAQSVGQVHRGESKGSHKPSQSKAPRHGVAKQADKGKHTARSTEQVEAQQLAGQTVGQASSHAGYSNQVGRSTQSEYSSNSGLLTL